jgi:hypothetical protein
MAFHIPPDDDVGPVVGPSSVWNRCRKGSSLVWRRQMNHCSGCPTAFSMFCITPPLYPVSICAVTTNNFYPTQYAHINQSCYHAVSHKITFARGWSKYELSSRTQAQISIQSALPSSYVCVDHLSPSLLIFINAQCRNSYQQQHY